jgi:hypothetical protein
MQSREKVAWAISILAVIAFVLLLLAQPGSPKTSETRGEAAKELPVEITKEVTSAEKTRQHRSNLTSASEAIRGHWRAIFMAVGETSNTNTFEIFVSEDKWIIGQAAGKYRYDEYSIRSIDRNNDELVLQKTYPGEGVAKGGTGRFPLTLSKDRMFMFYRGIDSFDNVNYLLSVVAYQYIHDKEIPD